MLIKKLPLGLEKRARQRNYNFIVVTQLNLYNSSSKAKNKRFIEGIVTKGRSVRAEGLVKLFWRGWLGG